MVSDNELQRQINLLASAILRTGTPRETAFILGNELTRLKVRVEDLERELERTHLAPHLRERETR